MNIIFKVDSPLLLSLCMTQVFSQSCTLTCPGNMVLKSDVNKEGVNISFPNATANGDCGAITYTPSSGSFFRLGSHTVSAVSASGQKCFFTVTVTDNESPQLSKITLSKKKLWPASNKMKKVGVYYTATDNAVEVRSVLTVTSNSTDAANRGWEVVNDHLLRLKAAILPNGGPRIYYITVTATDASGNKTTRTTSIAVSETMVAISGTK